MLNFKMPGKSRQLIQHNLDGMVCIFFFLQGLLKFVAVSNFLPQLISGIVTWAS